MILYGGRSGFLLMEVQCAELVGDELQTPKLEGLGRRKRWRRPQSIAGDRGELQRAEADRLTVACRRSGEWSDRNYPIAEAVNAQSAPHGRRQTVGSENGQLSNYSIASVSCVGSDMV